MNAVELLRQKIYDKLQELMTLQSDIADVQKRIDAMRKEIEVLYSQIDEALDKKL